MPGQTEATGFQQLLRRTPGQLSVQFYVDGAAADPGDTAVAITRADGTTLTPAATVQGATTEARTLALAASEIPDLDLLTITWTSQNLGTVETTAEVVGGHLFTIAEARAWDKAIFQSPEKFPTATLERARWQITESFQEILGFAPVPRLKVVTLDGPRGCALLLPDHRILRVRSIALRDWGAATWTPLTEDELGAVLIDDWGRLSREFVGWWCARERGVQVAYEHGWQRPPEDIRLAALMLLRSSYLPSDIDDRATSMSNEAGTFTIATAGTQGNPWSAYREFGIPYVDAALTRYSERTRHFA